MLQNKIFKTIEYEIQIKTVVIQQFQIQYKTESVHLF